MSFTYKNPISSTQITATNSVDREKVFGTNFSVLQTGGYMEVYNLSDLKFTIPDGDTGQIEFTGNTIPVNYSKRTLPFLPDNLTLNSDNISSGRRRLGMLVYVHETQLTYQYTISNFETLWDNASGSTTESDYTTTVSTSTDGGTNFIDAWLDSSVEGQGGVTRENARWKIFYGTDWEITGGTYNSGTGTLSLDNNTGGTINVTGFTSETYGPMSSNVLGLGKLFSDIPQNIPVQEVSEVVERTYGIQFNENQQLVVNVPWENGVGTVTSVTATTVGTALDVSVANETSRPNLSFTFAGASTDYINGSGDLIALSTLPQGTIEEITTSWPNYAGTAMSLSQTNPSGPTAQLNFTAQGNSTQYVDGTFALQTFPDINFTGLTTTGTTGVATLSDGVLNIPNYGGAEDDTYLTGATYAPTTLTLGMNDGTEFNVGGFAPEITGGTLSNGTLSLLDNTNGSVEITGFTTSGNLYSADGQLESNRVVDQNSNSLTFSGGSVSMGTETTSPVCALLELASTNQGLLIPRMTQVQRLAINTPLPGLLLYCTDTDSNGEEGMYMYKSQGWVNVL